MWRQSEKSIVPRPKGSCSVPTDTKARTYRAIVRTYIKIKRFKAAAELNSYAELDDLRAVIQYAALCRDPQTHKRHPHQRRIPNNLLIQARDRLLNASLKDCSSFDELICLVQNTIGMISGIGNLTVYDISTRIGAFLRLEPNRIYLHAGTRAGARALLSVSGRDWISPDELPQDFTELEPREIEDCLCLWKDELWAIVSGNGQRSRSTVSG